MYTLYEAEATQEYVELVASQGEFDALANRRVDETRRPGSYEQFQKESAAGQHRRDLDAERQRRCQSESEERRSYSHERAEEIQAREGGLLSPMAHSVSSPTTATSGTPVKQKKKLTWDEYHERKTHGAHARTQTQEEVEWQEKLRKQQEELAACQDELDREVDRLKREQEALAEQAGRQQLECLRARQKQQHEERREHERQEKEQQESR